MDIGTLFNEYGDDVFNLLVHMTKDRYAAEDLTQDTFIKALQHAHTFRGGNAKAWVLRIARNTALDFFRRHGREVSTDVSIFEQVDDKDPQRITESHEITAQLVTLVDGLKANYRDVVVCRLVMDLSIEETAAVLGWPSPRVRVTLHRALAALRKSAGKEVWVSGLQR